MSTIASIRPSPIYSTYRTIGGKLIPSKALPINEINRKCFFSTSRFLRISEDAKEKVERAPKKFGKKKTVSEDDDNESDFQEASFEGCAFKSLVFWFLFFSFRETATNN